MQGKENKLITFGKNSLTTTTPLSQKQWRQKMIMKKLEIMARTWNSDQKIRTRGNIFYLSNFLVKLHRNPGYFINLDFRSVAHIFVQISIEFKYFFYLLKTLISKKEIRTNKHKLNKLTDFSLFVSFKYHVAVSLETGRCSTFEFEKIWKSACNQWTIGWQSVCVI